MDFLTHNKFTNDSEKQTIHVSRYYITDKPAGHTVRFFIENLAVFPSSLCVYHEEDESEIIKNEAIRAL